MTIQRLVSTKWVAENLNKVVLVDGSWHMPASKRNPYQEFKQQHIRTARFFDVDRVADTTTTNLPHMLPSKGQFDEEVGKALGISTEDHVVVYDSWGIGPACRVYWTFRAFGHKKVSVLDGGLVKWIAEGRAVEGSQESIVNPKHYKAEALDPNTVASYSQMCEWVKNRNVQIVDARPAGRFDGRDPEPRQGLSSGHMPHSINIPFNELIDQHSKTLLPIHELKALFKRKGLALDKPIVTTCGSGMTAAIVFFALEQVGVPYSLLTLYDGSWTEYASKPTSLIIHSK